MHRNQFIFLLLLLLYWPGRIKGQHHFSIPFSTIYYTFQENNSNGVIPDIPVAPSFSHYANGRDPVIEKILALPWHKKSRPPM